MFKFKPLLNQDKLDAVYAEILGMTVPLDPDPLAYGPERINQRTAETQNMLSRVERLLTQTVYEHHVFTRQQLASETDLEFQTEHLIARDPEIAGGSSYKDRLARARMKLGKEIEKLNLLTQACSDLEILSEVLKTKRSELRNLQQRLKDQFRICQEEIGLGARWGRPRPPEIELEPGQGTATFGDVVSFQDLAEEVSLAVSGASCSEQQMPQAPSLEILLKEEGTGVEQGEEEELFSGLLEASGAPVAGTPEASALEDFDLEALLGDDDDF